MRIVIIALILFTNSLMAQINPCDFRSVWTYDCLNHDDRKELIEPILVTIEYYNSKRQKVTTICFDHNGYLCKTNIDYVDDTGRLGYVLYDSVGFRKTEELPVFDSIHKCFIRYVFLVEPHKCSFENDNMKCLRDSCGRVIEETQFFPGTNIISDKYKYIYK